MKTEQIDELLKRTLDDARVSRGEKKILNGIVREHGSADHQLAFLRHRAFEIARELVRKPKESWNGWKTSLSRFRNKMQLMVRTHMSSSALEMIVQR